MLNIVLFDTTVLENGIFKAFSYISLCEKLSSWDGAVHDPRDFI